MNVQTFVSIQKNKKETCAPLWQIPMKIVTVLTCKALT